MELTFSKWSLLGLGSFIISELIFGEKKAPKDCKQSSTYCRSWEFGLCSSLNLSRWSPQHGHRQGCVSWIFWERVSQSHRFCPYDREGWGPALKWSWAAHFLVLVLDPVSTTLWVNGFHSAAPWERSFIFMWVDVATKIAIRWVTPIVKAACCTRIEAAAEKAEPWGGRVRLRVKSPGEEVCGSRDFCLLK